MIPDKNNTFTWVPLYLEVHTIYCYSLYEFFSIQGMIQGTIYVYTSSVRNLKKYVKMCTLLLTCLSLSYRFYV